MEYGFSDIFEKAYIVYVYMFLCDKNKSHNFDKKALKSRLSMQNNLYIEISGMGGSVIPFMSYIFSSY